jgi:hypothetical protein
VSVETTTTCDKCGDVIGQHSSHWTATFTERRDPNHPVPAVYLHPQPARLDICTECAGEVLGPLIRNARSSAASAVLDGRTPDRRNYWL